MSNQTGSGRAVVLGASITGLFAARALSDFFKSVVVLDADMFGAGTTPRKAVPQGNHIHAILPPAYQALKELMPEVIEKLLAGGAHLFDGGRDIKWTHLGHWLVQGETGRTFIGATRPFFESHLRQHVESLDNVEILSGHRFLEWKIDSSHETVLGVLAQGPREQVDLDSELTVDARGSGSKLLKELITLGFDEPFTEVVEVDLTYTSCLFQAPDFSPDWNLLLMDPDAPRKWTGGVIERVEADRWIVTQWGYFGARAPIDDVGFKDFAESLDEPNIADFLRLAEPVSECHQYRIPKCYLHRFDQLKRFPDRLVAMGDAVCKLNPIYGQGMTKAAKEGVFLWESLSKFRENGSDLSGFSGRFRKEMGNVGANWAWQLTSGSDLAYPQTKGKRPFNLSFINWYVGRLFARAETRLEVRKALMDAMALVNPPESIMQPHLILRALGL